jgi:hypothetical protein
VDAPGVIVVADRDRPRVMQVQEPHVADSPSKKKRNLSCPNHLVDYKRKGLRLKAMKYCWIENGLGWKDPDGVLLRCVNQEEVEKLLK